MPIEKRSAPVLLLLLFLVFSRMPTARGDNGHNPAVLSRFDWLQMQIGLEYYHPCHARFPQPAWQFFQVKGYFYVLRLETTNATTITILARGIANPKSPKLAEAKAKLVDDLKKSLIDCKERLLKHQKDNDWTWLQINSDVKYVDAIEDLYR